MLFRSAGMAQAAVSGGVAAWGESSYGQTAVPVEAQSGVKAIAAGQYHTAALKADGSVMVWGNNSSGQTNIPVEAQSGVVAIAAGASHTVAVKADGSVIAWGNNVYGQTTVPVAAQSGVSAAAGGFGMPVVLIGTGVITPAPLNAARSGNNFVISWPGDATGFILQSTLNLFPPVTWGGCHESSGSGGRAVDDHKCHDRPGEVLPSV